MSKNLSRTASISALALTALLAVSACAPPSGSGQGAQGDGEMKKVRIAFSFPKLFTTGLPYYVSKEKGFYEEAGLEVDAVFTGGGSETVQALVSGSADIGTETGGPAAVGAFSQGAPIEIISASTTGLDLLWFAKADSGVTDMDGLSGKKVGYSSTGSSSHIAVFALNQALEAKGLKGVQAEAIGSPTDNFAAVETGQIAAGWTQPPFLLEKVESGDLKIVTRGSELGDYADVAMRVNIASESFAERDPEALKAFLQVQDRAWDWIFENPEEAVKIWKKAGDLTETEDVLLQTFEHIEREAVATSPLGGRDKILDLAEEFKFIDKPLTQEQSDDLFELSEAPAGAGK